MSVFVPLAEKNTVVICDLKEKDRTNVHVTHFRKGALFLRW